MDTPRIARILSEMGTLLELNGENPFRCRAFHTAAQALKGLPDDLVGLIGDGTLGETPGLGEAMKAKVIALATTGRLDEYDALRASTPPGLVALLRIPGLGPKKIMVLRDSLDIRGLDDLRAAVDSGRIASVKGFGAKSAQVIRDGLDFVDSVGDRVLQSTAWKLITPLIEAVRAQPGVLQAEVCGSLRRRAETIGDLDILFASLDPATVLEAFTKLSAVAKVLAHGGSKASVRLLDGVQCDLRGVRPEEFPFALHYFTGSKAHNIAMRKRAIARGLKLSEYSLEGPNGMIPCSSEAELFQALGLAEIPPELREDFGEFAIAEAGPIPRLLLRSDLAGTFHCHTDWSDGVATLEEMAEAARKAGLQYLGIADHSRSAGYAGGLSPDRVRAQWAAIDALNQNYGKTFRLFKGTECDILADGSLDFSDDLLAGFDYVVASVHSQFKLGREEMTQRIIGAVRNPHTTMLGHPSGRLLLSRDAYAVDLDAVIAAAADSGCMIEINADPHRLDLDDVHCRRAKALGVPIVINPDAHSPEGLANLDYGVGVARRAGLGPSDIVNAATLEQVMNALAARRQSRPS